MRSAIIRERTFEEHLSAAKKAAADLRDALIVLGPSAPKDEAAWTQLMTSEEVAGGLGFLALLAAKNAQWAQASVNAIGDALANGASAATVDLFTERFIAGQVHAEMTCTCGQCPPCVARAKDGDEKVAKQITKALSPEKPKSRLVDARGKRLH